MQENRSLDHYFGSLQDAGVQRSQHSAVSKRGLRFVPAGRLRHRFFLPFHLTTLCINDVDHSEDGGLDAWDGGKWNEWVPAKGPDVMTYYNRTNLSFYYALADAYTICDANFCSFIGPTFPNRLFLFTGTIDPNGANGGPVLWNNVPAGGFTWTTYPGGCRRRG